VLDGYVEKTAAGFMERCAWRAAPPAAPGGLRARIDTLTRATESHGVRRATRGAAGRGDPRAGTCAPAREAPARGGVTCDTGVSSLAATTLRRFAHVWLRMRGCRKVSNAKETQPHASETRGGHGPVAIALCHGVHSACVLAVARDCGPSRAWRRVSQRADSEPPAGSSRFGRAAPSSGAI
jgi:hypothetical protein